MPFCQNCGSQIAENSSFCPNCGGSLNSPTMQREPYYNSSMQSAQQTHTVPKCQSCGHIGEWKLGPVLRPMDIVIGIVLLIFGFIPGIVYLGVVAAIRSNKDRREKICTKCGAKNLFSFLY